MKLASATQKLLNFLLSPYATTSGFTTERCPVQLGKRLPHKIQKNQADRFHLLLKTISGHAILKATTLFLLFASGLGVVTVARLTDQRAPSYNISIRCF